MVSFSCNYCNDVVTKGKIQNHARSCGSDSFSCVDCMKNFDLETIKPHTSCVSEVAKYQGKYQSTSNGNPIKRQRAPDSDDEGEVKAAPAKPKRVIPTFSDSDDEDWVKTPVTKTAPPKEAPSVSANKAAKKVEEAAVPAPAKKSVKAAPLEPCNVGSFQLGTGEEVLSVVKNVLEEQCVTSMDIRDLSRHLVDRYRKRIGKQVQSALTAVLQNQLEGHGIQFTNHTVSLQ